MAEIDLPEITDIRRLHIEPGDTLVVRLRQCVTAAVAEKIALNLKGQFGADLPVIVLDDGATLDVLSVAESAS